MRNYKCDPLMMGQRLKELRRNAKNSMSQLEFAEEIGTCLGNISKIEQGLRFPTMEILYDYMNYFDGDTVFFRDISHLYTVFTLLWMYATPIFYPPSLLQETAPWLLTLNPMYHFIDYFRQLVLYGKIPGVQENLICFAIGLVSLLLGFAAMSRNQKKFILFV